MKPVTIAVSVKHAGFAEELARGLMELVRPYFVEIPGAEGETAPESRWEVLVTDFGENEGLAACFEPYRVIAVQEDTCRISQIAGRISAAARKLRSQEAAEHPAYPDEDCQGEMEPGRSRLVIFRSFWGGAGVTTLAVAAGRMLSGAYGERVLYLPLTARDGSRMYRRETEGSGPEGTAAELYYRMKKGRTFCLDDYVCSDDAGLEYLSWGTSGGGAEGMSGEELTEFLRLLGKMTDYGWILADAGTGDFSGPAVLRVLVDSRQDCRCRPAENGRTGDSCTGELRLLVHNRGLENRLEPSEDMRTGIFALELMEDGESFLTDEAGTVEIILSKTYGAGIKKFSEWLLETVANPVEWWR